MRRHRDISIRIALAGLALSFSHCVNDRQPAQPPRPTFELKRQCAELGWKTYDKLVAEAKRAPSHNDRTVYDEPHFAVGLEQNTCYLEYETALFELGPDETAYNIRVGYIYDVLSNRSLANYGVTRHGNESESFGGMTEAAYKLKRRELMGF